VKGPSRFDIPFAHVRNLFGSMRTTRLLLVEPDPLTRAALSAAGAALRVSTPAPRFTLRERASMRQPTI
jgi:hypothetical protein